MKYAVPVLLTIAALLTLATSGRAYKTVQFVSEFGGKGGAPGKFSDKTRFAFDKDGNIYVADSRNTRIQKFDANGVLRASWAVTQEPTRTPQSVTVDSEGNLYVLEGDHLRKYIQEVVFERPDITDPDADYDGDGHTNAFETNSWDVTFTNSTGTYTLHVTSDPMLPDTDFDGNPRILDADGDGNAVVDM